MRTGIEIIGVLDLILGIAGAAYAPYHTQPASAPPAASPLDAARRQLDTARTHAGFAASGTSLNTVHLHTGHAVNCLVGEKDRRFDKQWGNVCQGQGAGALVDLKAAGSRAVQALRAAEGAVEAGTETLAAKELASARAGAKKVGAMLDDALKALK